MPATSETRPRSTNSSPNFARFVYDGDNSTGTGSVGPAGSEVIEDVFYGYFQSQGLPAEPSPFTWSMSFMSCSVSCFCSKASIESMTAA